MTTRMVIEQKLGDASAAQATLRRLRDLLLRSEYAFNPDAQPSVDEAEVLVAGAMVGREQ